MTEFIRKCPGFSGAIWPRLTTPLLQFAKNIEDPSRFTQHGLRPWSRLQLRCRDSHNYSLWFARVVAAESHLPLLTIQPEILRSVDQARRLLQLIQALDPRVSVLAWMNDARVPQHSANIFDESITISGQLTLDHAAALLKGSIGHYGIRRQDPEIDWLHAAKISGISQNAEVDPKLELALRRAIRDAADCHARIPLQTKHIEESPPAPSR